MESLLRKGIPTKCFYNNEIVVQGSDENSKNENVGAAINIFKPLPFRLKNLRGPSLTWKVFKKQKEAIQCARTRKNGLMVFPFECSLNSRLFLVAHPQIFWHYDSNRNSNDRCTYELISEFTVCKLYFDLEFEFEYNPNHDGAKMVNNFIAVVCYFIKKQWQIVCTRDSVMDLDSTTEKKFSRHLIFHLPNSAFCNNYNVGAFVTFICSELKKHIIWYRSIKRSGAAEVLESYRLYMSNDLSKFDILDFMVHDRKGAERLFCDESVYTKNRHFRLFQSTKYGRNAPLNLSKENVFKHSYVESDLNETLFLDSLVTFVSPDNLQNFIILEFCVNEIRKSYVRRLGRNIFNDISTKSMSQFPVIDEFIARLVLPGKVWRSVFFCTTGHLVYDIVGYRFCENIGREHRSNNIKYVVDVNELCYYQKCYDPDCQNFRSTPTKLPVEISFYLDDDSLFLSLGEETVQSFSFDDMQKTFSICSHDLNEVLNVIEDISSVG